MTQLLNRLIQLGKVFVEGRGLPFLGAGVSTSAGIPGNPAIRPTVSYMIQQLVTATNHLLTDKLRIEILQEMGVCPSFSNPCPFSSCQAADCTSEKTGSLDKQKFFIKAINNQLGKFCEILTRRNILNHPDIVSILQIDHYARLEPVAAHYYLSFLARETLINEIITTNYDCCLERAFSYTTGEVPQVDQQCECAVSIYDMVSYRTYGARRLFPYNLATILRVYKINGCANQLNNNSQHADSILLTERQLQHMDHQNRTWARDLLRDRTRSRSFIFSGFGSDEPQVRFSVLRLLEEFSQTGSGYCDQQNAIWLHLYSSQRSFSQNQIMFGFWNNDDQVEEHTFCGSDLNTFHELSGENLSGSGNAKLSADRFWQVIFQIVFLALIDRYTRPSYPGYRWLDELDIPVGKGAGRRHALLQWLDPAGVGRSVLDKQPSIDYTGDIPPLQAIDQLIGFQDDIAGTPAGMRIQGIPLSLWMRCLEGRIKPQASSQEYLLPECYYRPLLQQTNLVIALLMTLCVFTDRKDNKLPLSVEFSQSHYNMLPPLLFLHYGCHKILLSAVFSETLVDRISSSTTARLQLIGYISPPLPGLNQTAPSFFISNRYAGDPDTVGEVSIHLFYPVLLQTLIRIASKPDDVNVSLPDIHMEVKDTSFLKLLIQIIFDRWEKQPAHQPGYMARLIRRRERDSNND